MKANEMTFGIEIECCLPHAARAELRVGGYHNGIQIPGLPAGWNAQGDSSISSPAGHSGVEVVSPILKGADGIKQIKLVCEWLERIGAKVNRSTGFHVHVGWAGDAKALKRLAHDVAHFEPALYAATGTHSRETGIYCKSVRSDVAFQAAFKDGRQNARVRDRYHTLNVTNLTTGRRTVEFRCFAGTTNLTKILGYVRLCLGIVERALTSKRMSNWSGAKLDKSKPFYAGMGAGEIDLMRLFFALGWTKGRVETVLGDVQAEGLPGHAECKKELRRLAKKYDSTPTA